MATYSRKAYNEIASRLRTEYHISDRPESWETIENITASLADLFAQDSESFDRKKFYQAALGRDTVRREEW